MIEDFRRDHMAGFHGLPIADFGFGDAEWDPEDDGEPPNGFEDGVVPVDVATRAWRVGSMDYEGPPIDEVFTKFLEAVDTTVVKALIIGHWCVDSHEYGEPSAIVDLLTEAAGRFPALEALFIGDMSSEEAEVSWIVQADPGPLLPAYPQLRVLGIRGTTGLTIEPFEHDRLEELTFQGGGLAPSVVQALGRSRLPALTGLDLYLGTEEYGGGATVQDLDAVLSGTNLPALRHLGLRNAENIDEIAQAVATAPLVARLESLDLSLGSLTDDGAEALLAGQPLSHLTTLDLHHNFFSDAMAARLAEALPDVRIDLGERLKPEADWRDATRFGGYIAVGE